MAVRKGKFIDAAFHREDPERIIIRLRATTYTKNGKPRQEDILLSLELLCVITLAKELITLLKLRKQRTL